MKLLAIETSSTACSVALQIDGDVCDRHAVEPKAHTRILLPMIRDVLREADAMISNLDAIALGNGPGSFIGMRIGASVAQGLAYGAGLSIVPISSLAAVAAEVMHEDGATRVMVAQDARMHEIYLGCFEKSETELPLTINSEAIHSVGELDLPGVSGGYTVAGEGWQRYPELMSLNASTIAGHSDYSLPRAKYLLELARESLVLGRNVPPGQLQPAYLRQQVATPPSR